ncbi:unnamed protein product [Nesidiocoris tenuis]|uniref:Uncharacterized protein n=1 Tax=Nesidiocoris tenuis TaxID=355587 RepID=A0A6H5HKI0_9HEMI|nr:unnamed protein product [Nesidiocoris tenuis]
MVINASGHHSKKPSYKSKLPTRWLILLLLLMDTRPLRKVKLSRSCPAALRASPSESHDIFSTCQKCKLRKYNVNPSECLHGRKRTDEKSVKNRINRQSSFKFELLRVDEDARQEREPSEFLGGGGGGDGGMAAAVVRGLSEGVECGVQNPGHNDPQWSSKGATIFLMRLKYIREKHKILGTQF